MKKLIKWNKWIDFYGSGCAGLLVALIGFSLYGLLFDIDVNLLLLFNQLVNIIFKVYIICKLGILFWWMEINLNKEEKDGSI